MTSPTRRSRSTSAAGLVVAAMLTFAAVDQPEWAAVAAGKAAPAPSDYHVGQVMPIGLDGRLGRLVLLEDRRLTPGLRASLAGNNYDVGYWLGEHDPLRADLERHPLVNARLRLIGPTGAVVAEEPLDAVLAEIKPAPLHGLPSPAFLLTEDRSAGFGSYSGPITTLLQPAERGLKPVLGGLMSALKAQWRIVPSRRSATEEIESVACHPDFSAKAAPDGSLTFVTVYTTFRYANGEWHGTTRSRTEFWENDGPFPDRRLFP